MTQPDLFGEVHEELTPPMLSQQRRLTLRQYLMVDKGMHPLTHGPVNPDGRLTCGGCINRIANHRGYPKCDEPRTPTSRGPATDVRAWWPACPFYRPVDGGEPA